MNYCTITPDRGDRPMFFEFCVSQLTKVNSKPPMNAYLVNDKPTTQDFDLVPRIRAGVEAARKDGFKYAYCFESDDYYPADYFQRMATEDYDFIGYQDTVYYHLKSKTYGTFKHPHRSSLFTTAFKISALDGYVWPPDNYVFLDVHLWKWANEKKKKIKLLKNNPCLGIKHGVGKTGGKGHRMTFANKDKNLSFLRSRVDDEAFEFYTKLMMTL